MANNNPPPNRMAVTPEDCSRMLFAALEDGDLDLSVALYESDAVLFKKSGETMIGHDAIRVGNAALIALKPRFTIAFIRTTISSDGMIATSRAKAVLDASKADGQPVHDNIHTLEVMRKQPDGSWRYLIDDPYGGMRDSMKER